MSVLKRFFGVLLLALGWGTFAAEIIPPAPTRYFNDYANVVATATATRLNTTLESFERESSSQIVVAIFPKMQSDSSIEDYTVRVAQSWKAGQKAKDNGAVLFVFIQDRKMYLQVGYGLEGALPDAICKRIIENEIKPGFKAGSYDAGLTAGVTAILAAANGEYKGTGQTVVDLSSGRSASRGSNAKAPPLLVLIIIFGVLVLVASARRRGGYYYSSGGWSSSGGGWSGGGGGGGGFSGGGGSFGGGGAGGSW